MNGKATWVVGGILLVAIVLGGGYALMHHATSSPTAASNNTSSTTPTNTTSSGEIIQTKTAASIGQYLVDANGMPLYTFGGDTSGASNCSGSCIANWPIYDASSAPATLPANVTVIVRSDGGKQYAYKGMPLYTFTADTAGKVTGDGVANFHVAKP